MEKQELSAGLVAIGDNNLSYQEGIIEEVKPSMGSKSGMLAKIGSFWFHEDDVTITEVSNTPKNYYDIIKEQHINLKNDIRLLVRKQGKYIKSRDEYVLSIRKDKDRPRIGIDSVPHVVKQVIVESCGAIGVKDDENFLFDITDDIKGLVFVFWSVFGMVYK